ncbi:hypothetical protein ACFX15_038019 [Malus domestica]
MGTESSTAFVEKVKELGDVTYANAVESRIVALAALLTVAAEKVNEVAQESRGKRQVQTATIATTDHRYETDKSDVATNVAFFASDVKFRASLADATFAARPNLNGLVLAVEKPGCFIVDYNVLKQDLRFQFMNSIRVVGKPLNLNYIHMREDNRTSEPEPEVWIDLDISHSMLDVALENEVEDGLLLRDMGQGLGLRSGFIDGAISISAAACSDPDYPP